MVLFQGHHPRLLLTRLCYLLLSLSLHLSVYPFLTHPHYQHFQATHPNMRTYYFCTDTAKEMESWMKVMTDAALVHTEPARRLVLPISIHHRQPLPLWWNQIFIFYCRLECPNTPRAVLMKHLSISLECS